MPLTTEAKYLHYFTQLNTYFLPPISLTQRKYTHHVRNPPKKHHHPKGRCPNSNQPRRARKSRRQQHQPPRHLPGRRLPAPSIQRALLLRNTRELSLEHSTAPIHKILGAKSLFCEFSLHSQFPFPLQHAYSVVTQATATSLSYSN